MSYHPDNERDSGEELMQYLLLQVDFLSGGFGMIPLSSYTENNHPAIDSFSTRMEVISVKFLKPLGFEQPYYAQLLSKMNQWTCLRESLTGVTAERRLAQFIARISRMGSFRMWECFRGKTRASRSHPHKATYYVYITFRSPLNNPSTV